MPFLPDEPDWRIAYYTRLLADDHGAPQYQREARERLLAKATADKASR